ncbi:MAG TPA: hypothetical protein VKY57_12600 [Chitinispirillaceae bacterium]|nr:hypothetical protein [Chitinispirillaceae bacterium]
MKKSLFCFNQTVTTLSQGTTLEPFQIYQNRLDKFTNKLHSTMKWIRFFSNLRLAVFIFAIVWGYVFYRYGYFHTAVIGAFTGIVSFIILVLKHNNLFLKRDLLQKLITINSDRIARLNNTWQNLKDTGEDFSDPDHPNSCDLDIFGPGSVFQWIGSCHSWYGRKSLAEYISTVPDSVHIIRERQDAVRELSPLIDWRQQFEAVALNRNLNLDPQNILEWAESNDYIIKYKTLFDFFYILPFFSFLFSAILLLFFKNGFFALLPFAFHLIIFGSTYHLLQPFLNRFENYGEMFLVYTDLFRKIEKQNFFSPILRRLHETIGISGDTSVAVRKLGSIISSIQIRYSPMGYFFANFAFLWDIRSVINAEKWKKKYGILLRKWLLTCGEFEALSSISSVHFENPRWVFADITDSPPFICAKSLGHPLISSDKRVSNDINLNSINSVAIITGSNMSGKSTFLRTVGVNLILAYTGAPVCASQLSCSVLSVYSSMRIGDNLENGISTFYAELLKIRKIIDAVNGGEKILFLLDELFRGTNSQDRHDGAIAVLNALKTDHTLGIISTHDFELSKLGKDPQSGFLNFHFKEYYKDNNIHFDYKLNSGPSTTRNALYLIRMAGIEI